MTAPTCAACQVTLDHDAGYRDDQGRPLCAPCYWKAASA